MPKASPKLFFFLSLVIFCLSLGYVVYGWVEPVGPPPGGNVYPPINTSPTDQTKEGRLSALELSATRFNDTNGVPGTYYVDPSGGAGISAILAGKVGIGTTAAPQSMLHLYGSSDVALRLQRSDAANPVIISTNANGPMLFYTGGSTQMVIDSSGNVGIGTTGPLGGLDVYKDAGAGNYAGIIRSAYNAPTYNGLLISTVDESANTYIFQAKSNTYDPTTSGTSRFVILGNGKVGIGEALPSATLHVDGTVRFEDFASCTALETDLSGNLLCGADDGGSGGLGGSGTDNYIPRFNGTSALEDSVIRQDDTNNVSIGQPPEYGIQYPLVVYDFVPTTGDETIMQIRGERDPVQRFDEGRLKIGTTNRPAEKSMFITSDNDSGSGLLFQTRNAAGVHDSMAINGEGNVGIGTTGPGRLLDVADRARLRSGAAGSAGLWFANNAGAELSFVGVQSESAPDTVGFWNGDWRLVVNNNGNVGIGTTAPTAPLQVARPAGNPSWIKTTVEAVALNEFGIAGANNDFVTGSLANDAIFKFSGSNFIFVNSAADGGGAVEKMRLTSTGNVGIGNTAPASALSMGVVNDATRSYLQIDAGTGAPAAGDCDADSERGRMFLESTNNRLYICNGAARGWDYIAIPLN